MGVFIGLLLGLGLFLLVMPWPARSAGLPRWRRSSRTSDLLVEAGVRSINSTQVVLGSLAAAVLAFLVVLAVSGTVPLAVAFAIFAGLGPRSVLRRRAHARAMARREAWPEAVDHLVSAVRAGLSLPEGLAALGSVGPVELQAAFLRFERNYQASGSFLACLDELADDLADPIGDRVVEALRVAREVGGTDLGGLLRTLARFLREDSRTRGELEARQSWTVSAARIALAAPWLVLLLLATQSSTIEAYNSASGALLLAVGGGVSYVAFVLMRRIGRLPAEGRVLR